MIYLLQFYQDSNPWIKWICKNALLIAADQVRIREIRLLLRERQKIISVAIFYFHGVYTVVGFGPMHVSRNSVFFNTDTNQPHVNGLNRSALKCNKAGH